MGFAQLYYTSCEDGLSGNSGYQFNAVTPGVPADVLAMVERFTGYAPPRSLPFEQTGTHPINLCYTPDMGGSALVARVVSVGNDPSGRPGNYFAHCLVSTGAAALTRPDSAEPLPAELWQAGVWAGSPVAGRELPEVTRALVPGPLNRARIASWVAEQPAELTARIVSAVDLAMDDGPPVVLAADSATVAHWVVALSHLLHPGRAREMSFATYTLHPADAEVHVAGVYPETATALRPGQFAVFDLAADTPPGDVDPGGDESTTADPLAERLVAMGAERVADLWRAADGYASGTERSLADWRPVVAASAAVRREEPLAGADLVLVRDWLAAAVDWLAPGDTATLFHLLLAAGESALAGADLVALREAAARAGATGAAGHLEAADAMRAIDDIAAGQPAPPPVWVSSEAARSAASGRIAELLDGANCRSHPERGALLVRWARSCELQVDDAALARFGREVVAPSVGGGAGPSPEVMRLLGEHAPVRRGVAEAFIDLDRDDLAERVSGAVGAMFADDDQAVTAAIRELHGLSRSTHTDPVVLLFEIVRLRREARLQGGPAPDHDLDAELLARVWGPTPGPGAVLGTVRRLRPGVAVAPDVAGWVTEALVDIPDDEDNEDWRDLARELHEHWMKPHLPEPGPRVLGQWERYQRLRTRQKAAGEDDEAAGLGHLRDVYADVADDEPAVRTVAHREARDLLAVVSGPGMLADALRDCPEEVFTLYRAYVVDQLTSGVSGDSDSVRARLATTVYTATQNPDVGDNRAELLLNATLRPALREWGRGARAAVRDGLPETLQSDFDDWLGRGRERRPGGAGELLRRVTGWHRGNS